MLQVIKLYDFEQLSSRFDVIGSEIGCKIKKKNIAMILSVNWEKYVTGEKETI